MVKSHIQMPRCILKRFEKNEKFYYYDVEKKIIGKNGHAKSLNTQYGYYSPDFEEFLSNNIESPIGELLKALDEFDFEQPNFELSNEFELRTRRLFYSLISRSPSFHNEINNRSDFFRLLNEQDQHDLVAYNGIKIAIEKKLLEEFAVTLTINKTRIPFLLPVRGIYSAVINKNLFIILPVSETVAITMVYNNPIQNNLSKNKTLYEITDDLIIERLNAIAFAQQIKEGTGFVISSNKTELERVKNILNAEC